jgi:hypothetical protein
MKSLLAILVLVSFAMQACANWTDTPIIADTSAAACEVLKNHMAKVEGLAGGKPDVSWYCDELSTSPTELLRMIQLRSSPTPHTLPISQLIGTFAVARRSPVVLELDVAELRLVPVSVEYSSSK